MMRQISSLSFWKKNPLKKRCLVCASFSHMMTPFEGKKSFRNSLPFFKRQVVVIYHGINVVTEQFFFPPPPPPSPHLLPQKSLQKNDLITSLLKISIFGDDSFSSILVSQPPKLTLEKKRGVSCKSFAHFPRFFSHKQHRKGRKKNRRGWIFQAHLKKGSRGQQQKNSCPLVEKKFFIFFFKIREKLKNDSRFFLTKCLSIFLLPFEFSTSKASSTNFFMSQKGSSRNSTFFISSIHIWH